MDAHERKVIRWKRDLLASNIIMDDVTMKKLKNWDLIWDSVIKELQESEIKNDEKVWKYLEHLMRAKLEKNAFQSLCKFLDEENPWISSELREELILERGQLKLDEYIKNEAATLVHRHFGGTKRFSEGEKKQFEDLLATRNQCTKNIWMRNLEQTRQALNEQIAISEDRNNTLREVISKIQSFLNSSDTPVKEFYDQDLQRSFSSLNLYWRNDSSNASLLTKLETSIDKLLENSKAFQQNFALLEEEKMKSLRILQGFANEHGIDLNSDGGLDKGVKKWLQKITENQNAANRELAEKEKHLLEMKLKIEQIEEQNRQELKERDQNIRFLASSLEKLHVELDSRNHERVNLEANLNRTAEKSLELEEKVKYWETFRRYGYWHGRNHEQCVKCHRDSSLDRKLLQMRPRKDTGAKKHVCKAPRKSEKSTAVAGGDF